MTRLLLMSLGRETDVVLCRNRARAVAETLGFDKQQQVKIATAVSEIARNAFRYARKARAEFSLAEAEDGLQYFMTTVVDEGPGIPHLSQVLAGTYTSTTGMGTGIRGSKRLMDRLDISTGAGGTTVALWQKLPRGTFIRTDDLARIGADLAASNPADPLEELATQNRELVATLEEVRMQRLLLEEVNQELSETNRGVVALYDELETVHRVGRVVASKLELDSLLSAITDATTDLSASEFGAFLHLDPAYRLLRWQCSSGILGGGIPDFPPPDVAGLIPDEEADIQRFDGDDCPASLRDSLGFQSVLVCPIRDEQKHLMGALIFGHRQAGVFTERTERILPTIALQAAIGISHARLFRKVQTANDAKAQFLAVLSHELRTPLNPVFAILTSLKENVSLPVELKEDVEIMRRNLQLEATLIDDLLDLTRISEGKLILSLANLDLHATIRSVVHTCGMEISRKRIRISVEVLATRHHVHGDAVRLQQALWNLLNNAVKFTPEDGTVTIRTENLSPEEIQVSVCDTGRGIEAEALERVFTAFEQEDSQVTARFGGLGLGLAISKGIMSAHGGRIAARSAGLGHGAEFMIALATVEASDAEEEKIATNPVPSEMPALRILVVDDHEDTRFIMTRMLAMRGYIMSDAGTVAEALEKFQARDIDIVISDVGLPDGSGHELMKKILAIRPVEGIALSGYGMQEDVARSLSAGFSVHLIKPVDFDKIDAAIDTIARRLFG